MRADEREACASAQEPDERPSGVATVPGFPLIKVIACWHLSEDPMPLTYYGWPEDLIAAGIMPADMREPNGKHFKDANGNSIHRIRYWKQRAGGIERYFKIHREVPAARLGELPGAREAVAARAALNAWDEPAQRQREQREQPPARPALRLVVDNDRVQP